MIELPNCPPIREASPRLIGYFTDQVPVLGGPQSRVSRVGDRWGIDIQTFTALYAEEGKTYLSRLLRGMRETVVVGFPEPGVTVKDYGTPVISEAGAAGLSLPVGGLTAGVVIEEGKFLSVVVGGQRYLYQVTANVTAVSGTNNLPIYPMIRRQPPMGAVVEIAAPKIEGFAQGNEQSWNISRSKRLPFIYSVVELE